jgi:hypothetical protein
MKFHSPMPLCSSINKIAIVFIAFMLADCSSKQVNEEQPGTFRVASEVVYDVTDDKATLEAYYQREHMKEWYTERIMPPTFVYDQDISEKSITELWLLRNEIYARNGFLFDDAILRGYFNQFKWYQPVFDIPEFKVLLNEQEHRFVEKALAQESKLMKQRYQKQGEFTMINFGHVYNAMQFKSISDQLRKALSENNFAIVPAKHEQFYHVYDNNHYQYVPSFITTDSYLQILHKHFSSLLQKIEEEKFMPLLTDLLTHVYNEAGEFYQTQADPRLKASAGRATTYLAIALKLLTAKECYVPAEWTEHYNTEIENINSASGVGSEFLDDKMLVYSQFTPRGNYTKTPELERYFRCMKWLNSARMYVDNDEQFLSAALIAILIKRSPDHLESFGKFNDALRFIVGDADNLSVSSVMGVAMPEEVNDPARLLVPETLEAFRADLMRVRVGRITAKGADGKTTQELQRPFTLFVAGRYTFDAEILSRLIHVTSPKALRPFPKGLDVFATLGNAEAENILINEYNEAGVWSAYPDSLQKLKKEFEGKMSIPTNVYSQTLSAINTLDRDNLRNPYFMKTPAWKRKNLVTSLAAWTELKHDMLLYTEQPYAAEAGQGGGPPPPQHLAYVEPNVAFWQSAIELVRNQDAILKARGLLSAEVEEINKDLIEIAEFLLAMSEKQLNKEQLSRDESDRLSWMGGTFEYLTFRIFGSDHLPEKERLVALVADVYNFNGVYLEEGVGMVDEIYVIAEINGKPYLTKGAVFSYHEFTNDRPLTDEQWRESLLQGKEFPRPQWTKAFTVKTESLESKPTYSF